MRTFRHQVPSLAAEVTGELDDEAHLAYFRGIPYATVEKRWTHSRIIHTLQSPFDATSFGPRCVQAHGDVLVSGGANDPVPGDHEFDCLNLNITTPKKAVGDTSSQLLPVMVWIHGGAFNYGANSVARYRPTKLCSIAAAAGTPIVLVQVGYRLGPLGFAVSSDLASEAEQLNRHTVNGVTTSGMGSYGFVDQINAFEWVRDHIREFGGDADNVTSFGISAGSASVHFHILTGKPLFDRAIMMSGAGPTLGPLPLHFYEKAWAGMCDRLRVTESSPSERLEHLRSIEPELIIANHSRAAIRPYADDSLLPSSWTFKDVARTRCKCVVLGDTRVEAIILDGMFKNIPQSSFENLVRATFSAADAQGFANAFGFYLDGEQSADGYLQAMRHFFSVMMFQYSNLAIAESSGSSYDAYLYHFEEPSPYPGPTYGVPYHGQCALYMHNNDVDKYPSSGKRIAQEMATTWTAFAHGRQPWEPYSKAKQFMRFGPGTTSTLQSMESDHTRDYAYLDWLRDHFEPTKTLAQKILQGEGWTPR